MFLKAGTLVDCGAHTIKFFNDQDLGPLDSNLFELILTDQESSLTVMYTEDLKVTGSYDFRYLIYYDNYPEVGEEQFKPFTVTIVDPCITPKSLVAPQGLSEQIKTYTIAGTGILYDIGKFIIEPSWCEVSYSYLIDDPLGQPVIADFDDIAPSFTFEYMQDLAPLEEDILQDSRDYYITVLARSGSILTEATFILRVQNPCSKTVGFVPELMPVWCPQDDSTYWNPIMPVWMEVIQDRTIYAGETFTYEFGEALNRYDQDIDVSMELGSTEDFAFYDHINNSYVVKGDLMKLGYWRLSIFATEVKNGRSYSY